MEFAWEWLRYWRSAIFWRVKWRTEAAHSRSYCLGSLPSAVRNPKGEPPTQSIRPLACLIGLALSAGCAGAFAADPAPMPADKPMASATPAAKSSRSTFLIIGVVAHRMSLHTPHTLRLNHAMPWVQGGGSRSNEIKRVP